MMLFRNHSKHLASSLNGWKKKKTMTSVSSVTVKYHYIGRLLKPGEEPIEYTDDEEGKEKKAD